MENKVQGTPDRPLPPLRINESPCDNVGKRTVVKTMTFPLNDEIGIRKQKAEPEPATRAFLSHHPEGTNGDR